MNERTVKWLMWIPGLAAILWMISEMHPVNGAIGHDFLHHFTRTLIGAANYWQNGFGVLNYSAALCGGAGIFADPQSINFSLDQFLTFFIEPWFATRLTILLFYLIGYASFYRLARHRFEVSVIASHVGSLFFITNGFFFANVYVGHMTHHPYFLLPAILDVILGRFDSRAERIGGTAFLALMLTYLLYAGSLHMLAVFGVSTLLLVPYWISRRSAEKNFVSALVCMVTALILFGLAAAAKFYAIKSYSPLFHIRGMDLSPESPWAVLLRYFYFLPAETPETIRWGEYLFGAWEYVAFVSKMTIPLVLTYVWYRLRRTDRRARLVTFATALLVLEVALIGVGWGGNEWLPFFSGYHNPIKLLAAFIPYICLLSALGADQLLKLISKRGSVLPQGLLAVFLIVLAAETATYTNFFSERGVGLGFYYDPTLYHEAKAHGRLPQTRNLTRQMNDWDAISRASASLACYEPLFGYRGETLGKELREGAAEEIRDGKFNLTHAGCLVYPDYFQCSRWERIPVADAENFRRFTLGQTPSWGVPPVQNALLGLSGFTVLLMVAAILASLLMTVRKKL